MNVLIYGANGYTGRLIVDYCLANNLRPSIAGRNKNEITQMAEHTGLDAFVVSLDDSKVLDKVLKPFKAVIHCAGPFVHTYRPMIESCLRTRTNYLDITGEIPVFESIFRLHDEIVEQKIVALPGAGFDVVPTDCLAGLISGRMPDATHLNLYIQMDSTISKGTALTMVEHMGNGSAIRKNGIITKIPMGSDTTSKTISDKKRSFVAYPWGDVSTAYHSTGIENIKVYMSAPPSTIKTMQISRYFPFILKSSLLKSFLQKRISRKVIGPTAAKRKSGSFLIMAEAINSKKETLTYYSTGPEGYSFTAEAAIKATIRILEDNSINPGFNTPYKAFGWEFLKSVDGVEIKDSLE